MAVSFARFTARNERGWLGRTLLLPQFGSRYWRSDLEQRELGFGGGPRVAALYDEAGCGARGERHLLRERAQASSRRLVGTARRASRACALGEPSSEDRFLSLLECSPDGVRPLPNSFSMTNSPVMAIMVSPPSWLAGSPSEDGFWSEPLK